MARLRYDNALGLLGASLGSGAGPDTITFAVVPSFATLVSPDFVPLVLDPPSGAGPNGNFEVVHLTAYTLGNATGTIARAQEGTTSKAHSSGAQWLCGPTSQDAAWLIEKVNNVTASGAAQTIPDVSVSSANRIVLTANCTLTFPTADFGKKFKLALMQDAAGSRTVTWPTNIKWLNGIAPTLSTALGVTDALEFVCLDGTNWYGFVIAQNMFKASAPVLTGSATAFSSGDGTASGDTVSVTIPGTAQAGDTILLFVWNANVSPGGLTPATPAGYSVVLSNINVTNNRTCAVSVYKKTAVSGDVGAVLTMAHLDNRTDSATAAIHVRTYTCGGVDSSASVTGTAATLAPSFINSTVASECQVSFFGSSPNGGTSAVSVAAGSTNTMAQLKPATGTFSAAFGAIAAEDWQLATAGSAGTGGTFTLTGATSPANVGVSVLLKPSAS